MSVKPMMEKIVLATQMVILEVGNIHKMELTYIKIFFQIIKLDLIVIQ